MQCPCRGNNRIFKNYININSSEKTIYVESAQKAGLLLRGYELIGVDQASANLGTSSFHSLSTAKNPSSDTKS